MFSMRCESLTMPDGLLHATCVIPIEVRECYTIRHPKLVSPHGCAQLNAHSKRYKAVSHTWQHGWRTNMYFMHPRSQTSLGLHVYPFRLLNSPSLFGLLIVLACTANEWTFMNIILAPIYSRFSYFSTNAMY